MTKRPPFVSSQPTVNVTTSFAPIITTRGTNEIIVTEGASNNGKAGYWISIYRQEGKGLVLTSRAFVTSAVSGTLSRK